MADFTRSHQKFSQITHLTNRMSHETPVFRPRFRFFRMIAGNVIAQQKTIVETAVGAGNFETLVAAVQAAGLVDTLNGHDEFTVFAPTDAAFAHVAPETLQALLRPENKDQLTGILTYHVVPGRVNASDAYGLNSAPTVNGQRLPLNFRGESLQVGEATITTTDIQCSNGVIHVIDAVLMPGQNSIPAVAQSAGQFNTLLAAVGAAGLAEVLSGPGPFTVFAPTDEAFASLPEGTVENLLKPENKQQLIDILKYHVIDGRVYDDDAVKARRASTLLGRGVDINLDAGGLMVNDARVVAKNIDASNGVVHVIDCGPYPSGHVGSPRNDFAGRRYWSRRSDLQYRAPWSLCRDLHDDAGVDLRRRYRARR